MALISPLFDGPLDIVGDIHGEIDALRDLLSQLGYTHDGREHPQHRRLVFVGDLCDRGPDSPAVVQLVSELVRAGVAQCILGNHELNVLRGAHKHGNGWITSPDHEENRGEYSCAVATTSERQSFASFFGALPLALERHDLRVVHAAWNDDAVAVLRSSTEDCYSAFERFEEQANSELAALAPAKQAALAPHERGRRDESYPMPSLPDVGRYDEGKQTLNPVRRITSGLERATSKPFFATGEWRFCDRVRWWNDYRQDTAVVFGHYWRIASRGPDVSGGKPDLFAEYSLDQWQGPRKNLYCVDFSVGGRFRERKKGINKGFIGRLGAVRWPERCLVFDDGAVIEPAR